jgi:hypothetical protein
LHYPPPAPGLVPYADAYSRWRQSEVLHRIVADAAGRARSGTPSQSRYFTLIYSIAILHFTLLQYSTTLLCSTIRYCNIVLYSTLLHYSTL